jgi:Core-2/I-Branching enzyme
VSSNFASEKALHAALAVQEQAASSFQHLTRRMAQFEKRGPLRVTMPQRVLRTCFVWLVVAGAALYFVAMGRQQYQNHASSNQWVEPGAYRAKIAFTIVMATKADVPGLLSLMGVLWDPQNLYLIHLDAKASSADVNAVKEALKQIEDTVSEGIDTPSNIHLMRHPIAVSWGGFSLLLTAVHGLTTALAMSDWDYWINLSTADMPLVRPQQMQEALGYFSRHGQINFVGGVRSKWDVLRLDRRRIYLDDSSLYLSDQGRNWPTNDRDRPIPDLFNVQKGGYWVVLHRSFAEYIHHSPDNVARSLLWYFSSAFVSDELFFQTLACHPKLAKQFIVINDDLRFIRWPAKPTGHPKVMDLTLTKQALTSGAFFARKFNKKVDDPARLAISKALHEDDAATKSLQAIYTRMKNKGVFSRNGEWKRTWC